MGSFKETFFFGTRQVVCNVTFSDTDRDDIREIVTEVSGNAAIDAIMSRWTEGKLLTTTIAVSVDGRGYPSLSAERKPQFASLSAYFEYFSTVAAAEELTGRHRQYREELLRQLGEALKA